MHEFEKNRIWNIIKYHDGQITQSLGYAINQKLSPELKELDLNERILPDRNTIESIKGGKGLMKRISASDGGIAEIKKEYPKWIINKIAMEENIQEEPDANSLNTLIEPKTENEGEKIINN